KIDTPGHPLVDAQKREVSGTVLVNGREVDDEGFKDIVGCVDLEDTLMSTLTVYETVLCSAPLRLSREIDDEAWKFRMLEMLAELGILNIKDAQLTYIVFEGHCSIYGGEKRRVSIACGLVTSPSIIFLGELTSISIYSMHSISQNLHLFLPGTIIIPPFHRQIVSLRKRGNAAAN
ncbi:hypothetical protein BDN70DRAFT_974113, partial [Pholiota conissans]